MLQVSATAATERKTPSLKKNETSHFMWMNAKPCSCKPIRCGQMWVFLCSMLVCMLLPRFFLRRFLFFLCFSATSFSVRYYGSGTAYSSCRPVRCKYSTIAKRTPHKKPKRTTLCEEVRRHMSTSFADRRCRMSIFNKHELHCWDSATLPNKLCGFKTLRCF